MKLKLWSNQNILKNQTFVKQEPFRLKIELAIIFHLFEAIYTIHFNIISKALTMLHLCLPYVNKWNIFHMKYFILTI